MKRKTNTIMKSTCGNAGYFTNLHRDCSNMECQFPTDAFKKVNESNFYKEVWHLAAPKEIENKILNGAARCRPSLRKSVKNNLKCGSWELPLHAGTREVGKAIKNRFSYWLNNRRQIREIKPNGACVRGVPAKTFVQFVKFVDKKLANIYN